MRLICALLLAACGSDPGDCLDGDGDGVTTCEGDCDDGNGLNLPGANEVCGDGEDNNCDGTTDDNCNGLGTFVSTQTGDDANPGTKAAPVATIAAGMANAATIGGSQSVLVAEGTYTEKVALAEGVDLLGGFACTPTDCSWARDPLVHDTQIANTDFEGVTAGAGITQSTLVEGFRIVGLDGAPTGGGSCGVTIAGGEPTLRGNRIIGGTVTAIGPSGMDRSIGVRLAETGTAGAVLDHNELTGGTSSGGSLGVVFDSYPARTNAIATVVGNTIRGGAGVQSVGILAWNSAAGTLVSNNDITGGNSTRGASHGIQVGSTMTIDSNRINLDRATVGTCQMQAQWCSGILSMSSSSTITNNIVFGPKANRTAGVVLGEFEVAAGEVVLNGNTLDGGGIGALPAGTRTESAALVVTIGTCNTCGFNGVVGHVRNNILIGGTNMDRYGVREDPSPQRTMRVDLLENNLFWFSVATGITSDVFYRSVAVNGMPTDYKTIVSVNMMTSPPATNNLHADPLLDAMWHLSPLSPAIDKGTASEAPAADFDGEARPRGTAIDMGHDEF
jgi:hypothetical protein